MKSHLISPPPPYLLYALFQQRAIEQIESSSSSSTTNTTDLLSLDPYDLEDEVTLIDPTFRFNTTTDFNLETTQIGDSSTTTTTTSGFKQLYDAYRQLQYGDLDGWEDWGWMWPNEGF